MILIKIQKSTRNDYKYDNHHNHFFMFVKFEISSKYKGKTYNNSVEMCDIFMWNQNEVS